MKKKIVYTYGVFDLFHKGHVELLKEAKELGDFLIVGVYTDEIAQSFKRTPIISLNNRLALIESCKYVDQVIIQDSFLPDNILLKIKPDILAKGDGAGWEDGNTPPGYDTMMSIGGKVIKLSYHQGISTSDIIKKITKNKKLNIVSNNLLLKTSIKFDFEVIVRVNIAWVKTIYEIAGIINNVEHDIYLDYPQGRTKPPKPILSLSQAIDIANKYQQVKYFAVSNVEDPENIYKIKLRLNPSIQIIPKIETQAGIKNLEKIINKINCNYIMFDKEDLYNDVNNDNNKFEELVKITREKCANLSIHVLELQGVFFS